MTEPGFYGDYGTMKIAGNKIADARDSLGAHLSDFRDRAALDSAIPSLSGDKILVPTPGLMGPDIDQIETVIAQAVRVAYKATVDAVDGFLEETHRQLDQLSRDMSDSIREYRMRDEQAASGMPNVDHPR
ncbi:hypothetical protein MOQ72_18815 [Saccharopolyspora sp. K220]|uniref:hypothetical protein n=1 Tax=Saccharopolyspora soli TaxID=2926618 RepID=UPI001F5879AB|nr:hypothetical protein [Saccharopolyspora soli]MCI2419499.1 hypothetical protein [Saccharopolyspora soli]